MLLQALESSGCSSATSGMEFLPQGDETLSSLQCSGLTRGQLFALTLAFVLKRCLTQAATSDLIALLNAVARPLLQNCKQFNGRYGCGFCLHEGTATDKNLPTEV